MFERFTENARRAIFFARCEASQYGSVRIEAEHLLLGILQQDKRPVRSAFAQPDAAEVIRNEMEAQIIQRARISTSVEMPLSEESKRILNHATQSAENLGRRHIDSVHLFFGILREEGCLAARILEARGVEGERIRKTISAGVPSDSSRTTDIHGLMMAASRRTELDAAVDRLVEAWGMQDVGKILNQFEVNGQLWDAQGKLWSRDDPVNFAKGIAAHFTTYGPVWGSGAVKEVLLVAVDVAVVMMRWSLAKAPTLPATPRVQQIVAVMHENGQSWQIVSAFLVFVEHP